MAVGDPLIDVRLSRVVLRDGSDQQWIFLSEKEGQRGFPIIIGTPEAAEIHRVLTNEETPRPMTHRLTHGAIEALGGRILRVEVVDLRDNTFFARLVLERDGDEVVIDARPSDALALGLRAGCPIRVAESILEEVRTDDAQDVLPDPDAPGDEPGPPPEEPKEEEEE